MKKILCALICSVLMMTMLCGVALADPKHVSEAGLIQMVDDANAQIEALVANAIATPENDVKQLLKQVNKIVHDVKSYAKKLRAEVGCSVVTYCIDGQMVDIDPLFVVNIRQ